MLSRVLNNILSQCILGQNSYRGEEESQCGNPRDPAINAVFLEIVNSEEFVVDVSFQDLRHDEWFYPGDLLAGGPLAFV